MLQVCAGQHGGSLEWPARVLTPTAVVVSIEAESLNLSAEGGGRYGAMTVAPDNLVKAKGAIELSSVAILVNADILTVTGAIIELGESFIEVGGGASYMEAESTTD